jgi:hypothetical protein
VSVVDEFDSVLAKPETSSGDPLKEFDATPAKPKAAAKVTAPAEAGIHSFGTKPGEPDAVDQVIRSMVQNTGAGIIAGWRGMATLATGGTLEDAANNVNEELETRSYHPESEKVANVLASPYNPMNWVGAAAKKAGEVTQDVLESEAVASGARVVAGESGARAVKAAAPAVATGVETGVNALPLVLLKGGNRPIKPFEMMERAPEVAAPTFETTILPLEEQTRRAGILKNVGIEDMRRSALTGNEKEAATDFQQSKVNNQAGDLIRARLDAERAALTKHAETIVQDTGGTTGSDSSTAYARGSAIIEPLDKLSDFFNRQIRSLYKQADARAAGQPTALERFNDVLGTDSKFANTDTISLRNGVRARMKELGLIDKDGNVLPATVDQAESLRQYMNEEWSHRNGFRIRELKEALDDDVTSSAGEDIYGQARALRRMRAVTLDEPNGIGKLMDASGPEGINRAVPVEKIADTVAGMPVDQLAHVVRTLRTVPEELQPGAQAALSEIKAHFANKVLDAGAGRVGQWGARDVSRYIRNNKAKLEMVFGPEELSKLSDLEEAGRILRLDQSYPGAAVQEHNLVRRGAMAAIRAGAAAAGGAAGALVGAPGAGAAAGEIAGAKLTARFSEAAALRAAQKRFVRIQDVGR